jgi:hypothetical protein
VVLVILISFLMGGLVGIIIMCLLVSASKRHNSNVPMEVPPPHLPKEESKTISTRWKAVLAIPMILPAVLVIPVILLVIAIFLLKTGTV